MAGLTGREVEPTLEVGSTFAGVGAGVVSVAKGVVVGAGVAVANGMAEAELSVGWVGAGLGKDIGVDGGAWPPQAASPNAITRRPARSIDIAPTNLAGLDERSLRVFCWMDKRGCILSPNK